MKQHREPTFRQKRFVHELMKGKSKKQAALDAGYSENVATDTKRDIQDKPGTRAYLLECMKKAGITQERLAQVLRDGLDATGLYGKDSIEHEDHAVRLQYTKYINELGGIDSTKHVDLTSGGEKISFGFKELLNDKPESKTDAEGVS